MKSSYIAIFILLFAGQAHARPKKAPTPPPLIRMVEAPPSAKPVPLRFQDWVVADFTTFIDSWTSNESGSIFGVACGSTCIAYVNSGIGCDKGDEYPALISLPDGVRSVMLRCYDLGNHKLLATPFTVNWVDAVAHGGTVGVAMAMKDGSFSVHRFSLNGIIQALSKMDDIGKSHRDNGKALRDFTI